MKVALSWLQEFLDLPTTDPERIADDLASLGHEVEGYDVLEPGFSGIVVGRVEEVAAHPNADRIRVCQVDVGAERLEIICGAWNFDAGAVVPVAVPGATLGEDFEITRREIRGVTSNGMICSARELGLGDDHEGILVLDPATPVGADFTEFVALPDVVFDVTITPNRPDAMSMWGIARDLAALWQTEVKIPEITVVESDAPMDVEVTIEAEDGCRRFVGRQVDGIAVAPAPLWMQLRLERAGIRSINNVVDISNYVMLELGQPTHIFDRAKIAGDRIVVRWAEDGETLTTLDGVDRTLTPEDLVVADAEKPSALAGTMGGEESEVSDGTEHVFIEGASWDPPTVLRMSRRHGLRSEASARFERNVDPELGPIAVDRVAQLVAATAGGDVRAGRADVYPRPEKPRRISLDPDRVRRLLGVEIGTDDMRRHLEALGMGTVGDEEGLVVTVPTFRPDVTRPIDLVEEIARLHGFDNIPETLPAGPGGGLSIEARRQRLLRRSLQSAGLHEAKTFSFHGRTELEMLGLGPDDIRLQAIAVANPLREEESLLRTTLLVGLLKSLRYNVGHGIHDVGLYEIGRVFFSDDMPERGVVPHQPIQAAFAAAGRWGGDGIDDQPAEVDVFAAAAIWEHIAEHMGIAGATVRQVELPGLHPGRGGEALIEGAPVGFIGELHPAAARRFGLEGRVIVGEFDVEQLTADRGLWQFKEPSVFPPVEFDLSFEVPAGLSAARIVAVAGERLGSIAESVRVFDEYVSDAGRSLAIRVVLRAADRTLTSEEAAPHRQAVIEAIEAIGGRLRGA